MTISMLIAVAFVAVAGPGAAAQDGEFRRAEQRARFEAQQQPADQSLQRLPITPCVGGFAGIYPCNSIDLLTFMPLSQIGGGNGNDIWGWVDPLNQREYAIMGRSNGTSFVDITDPLNPTYLGTLPPHGANSSWRDIKVYANHAYIVSEAFGHGMQVFDLTQLRGLTTPMAFSETAHYDDFGSAHNVAINEDTGFAYAVGTTTCGQGLHFVDLANPAAPVFAGCHIENTYTHDSQCVVYAGPDIAHQGKEICINSNENKFNVIDVTAHSNPIVISSTTYSGDGYTHQGWLTEDHEYWLLNDELDEQQQGHNTRTRIFDVRNLDNPILVGSYDGPTSAIDHNLYTHKGFVYESNYRAGLRILDPVDVASGTLTEVAYFDIYPSSNSASFNGAWSVYPYFPSGNVVVSGIEQGLFVLRPILPAGFDLDVAPGVLALCDGDDGLTTVTLEGQNGFTGIVSLSASGLPAGASTGFAPNPVSVPGTAGLTVSAAGVTPGAYAINVNGVDGPQSDDKSLMVEVANLTPAQPVPTEPPNGTSDASLSPELKWNGVVQGYGYVVEIATDPGFGSIVYSDATPNTSSTVQPFLDALTTYYWRVRATNGCGTSADSPVFSFTTRSIPRVLLIDDDDNSPDVRPFYTAALDALGEDYDVWDTENTDDEPSAAPLAPYEIVIWFTGDEFGGSAGPGPGGESALESWLGSSRCMLISSQDYYNDRLLSNLIQDELGVSSINGDVIQTQATGQGQVFGGLGPYSLAFPYSNFSDALVPDGSAQIAFSGSNGTAAVQKDTGYYRTVYAGFGLAGLPDDTARQDVLGQFLDWCEPLPTLDGDSDGTQNDSDCSPGNAGAWALPAPVETLVMGFGGNKGNMAWQPTPSPGASSISYDVLRSGDPADFANATCVESGQADNFALDEPLPVPGTIFHYVIRVENTCGGTIGFGSTGGGRSGSNCP